MSNKIKTKMKCTKDDNTILHVSFIKKIKKKKTKNF